jgi:hypothetical protein
VHFFEHPDRVERLGTRRQVGHIAGVLVAEPAEPVEPLQEADAAPAKPAQPVVKDDRGRRGHVGALVVFNELIC